MARVGSAQKQIFHLFLMCMHFAAIFCHTLCLGLYDRWNDLTYALTCSVPGVRPGLSDRWNVCERNYILLGGVQLSTTF